MAYLSEDDIEQNALDEFSNMGYQVYRSNDYKNPNPVIDNERNNNSHIVILEGRLRSALMRINGPYYNKDIYNNAIHQVKLLADSPDLMTNNHRLHQLIINGVKIPYLSHGEPRTHVLKLIDFNNVDNNDFLATDQFTVKQGSIERRPDITLFINGLPLVTFELKNPSNRSTNIRKAYDQLQTYKSEIFDYMKYNEILIISDDDTAEAGSMTSEFDRFMTWRSPYYRHELNAKSQLVILIKYMLNKSTLLNIINNFIIFETYGDKTIKILAAYHQYYMVNKVVHRAQKVLKDPNNNKIGTVWHTQGSGKSLAMVFFTQIISKICNPTIVLLNDRDDLDEQLNNTFSAASEYLRQEPKHATTRNDIRKLLSVNSGGIIFTTIQKFAPENNETHMPILTKRHDVIVIADEAHRSQYGLSAKFSGHKGLHYGFARYMRDSMPNASFIGFTGTPIDETGKSTKAVFGNYIDIYDMTQAIKDHMTVKIYYESRVIPLSMNHLAEAKYKKLLSESRIKFQNNSKRSYKWKQELTQLKSIAGAQPRINKIAKDFVHHFEARYHSEHGKAIFVSISRRNAVRLYNAIIKLRPSWGSKDLDKGVIKVVMTSAASDGPEMNKFKTKKHQREFLQHRMKDPNDSLKVVIVVSMWLTGFDAPDVSTMYIDKPMHGHNLMQAIARINRVFKDKTGALVVDYIGIADSLKKALQYYSHSDRKQEGINVKTVKSVMMAKYHIIKKYLYDINYSGYKSQDANVRIKALRLTLNYLLGHYNSVKLHKFCDTVTQLQKAYSLIPTSKHAILISDEMSFFAAVKNGLLKIKDTSTSGVSQQKLNYRMRHLLDQSVIPGDPRDLYSELGLKRPNISMLSTGFLNQVQHMQEKSLAATLMQRLVRGQIHAIKRTNLTQSEHFGDMLKDAIKKYNNRAITTEAVINELIKLAKELNEERNHGKVLNLSPEEEAFYDALAHYKEAVQIMGNKKLYQLAKALVKDVKAHSDTDWTKRPNLRAKMLVSVKHLLRHYHYPRKYSRNVQIKIVKQAELISI